MEKINTVNNATVINENTTLGELIAILGDIEKAEKTPTPKKLREEAGDPVAREERTLVYANGYAVYDNGSGRTVLWIPDCKTFTYHFDPLKDTEKGEDISETSTIDEETMKALPWAVAITLVGDHRVEANLMNRTGSRKGTKDYDSSDNGDKDGDTEKAVSDSYENEYHWREDRFGENPETAYIRKESLHEALDSMTDKQREVFVLYYQYGYTQQEIAGMIGISQQKVQKRLSNGIAKMKKS